MKIDLFEMVAQARDLCTEDDSNPEYDRALLELTCRCFGIGQDEPRRETVRLAIGVKEGL